MQKLIANSQSSSKDETPEPNNSGGLFSIPKDCLLDYNVRKLEMARQDKLKGASLIPAVQEFKDSIQNDPVLRMWFTGALDSLPEGSYPQGAHPDQLFHAVSSICTSAPSFKDEKITGVPILSLFMDMANTQYGQTLFSHHTINEHLKNIFNAYNNMLRSKVSLQYLNEDQPYGWFCSTAQKYVEWEDYYVQKTKDHWGFQNWNEWFTRKIRPQARPIDPEHNSIVHSSDSFPLSYHPNQKGTNPTYNVQAQNKFWLKDQQYSLYDMLGARTKRQVKDICDDHFIDGTIYQAFLDPWCYHRWHSPISGLIEKSYKINGTYYLSSPGFNSETKKNYPHKYLSSLPMLSMVSTRQIYIIKMLDGSDRRVAVIQIGMAEVSSCNSTVIEGQVIKKGEQLGFFEFGGSSYAIIFDKNFNLTFDPEIFHQNSQGQTNKQLVNSCLAKY